MPEIDPTKYAEVRRLSELGAFQMVGEDRLVAIEPLSTSKDGPCAVISWLRDLSPGDASATRTTVGLSAGALDATLALILEVKIKVLRRRIAEHEAEIDRLKEQEARGEL